MAEDKRRQRRRATTPEGRENQMVSLAVELAERQLRDGTASAQVISHFLKLGSSREKLEQEKIANDNKLTQGKIEQLSSQARMEEIYTAALNAMKAYGGQESTDQMDEFDG